MREDTELCHDEELVDPFYISPEDVEEELGVAKAPSAESLQAHRWYTLVTDAIEDMEWWSCFQPPKSVQPTGPAESPNPYDVSPTLKPTVKKKKIGRNERCPCGSGKKYKKCCGRP
jgi:preprotein translocase subunit SecA